MTEKLDFLELIGDSVRKSHQLLQTESSPLNKWQCQHLEQKLKEVQQILETYTGDRSSGPLKELHRYVKETEDLVRQCCSQPWMRAAISQAENRETFYEVICDLDWCITLLQDAAASTSQGKRRRRGAKAKAQQLAEQRRKIIESVNNDAAQKDRDELKVRLEREIKKPQLSHDNLTLAEYLLARLTDAKASKGVHARRTRGRRIGQGGYGKVYEISWLGETYAEKAFDSASETERKSFEREGYSLRSLRHRNVVQLIDHFANDKECSLVMELMSGGDLYGLIKSRTRKPSIASSSSPKSCIPPFSVDVMLDILVQMAKGLQYMHANKTAHRDLKSKNVLVSLVKHSIHLEAEGYVNVKLADFGMAKVKQGISTSFNPTTLSGFVGTSLWKAPELFDHPNPFSVDAFAADVYSYGITSSEVITGLFPFGTNGDAPIYEEDLITRIIEDGARPELPEDVCPPALAFLISKCWSVEPADRPSAAAIVRYLHDFKASLLLQAEFDYLSWRWNFNPDDSRDRSFDVEDAYSSGDDPVLQEPLPVNPSAGAEGGKAQGSPVFKLFLKAKDYAVSWLFQGSASSSSTGPSSELNSKDLEITSKELETKQFPFYKIQAASNDFDVSDFNIYVGEGPFARVFRGFFTGELREAAVRQLRLEKKSDPKVFLEKVAVMASIKHPNLINLVGYCENKGDFYLVHEYINSLGTIGTVLLGFNRQGRPLREVTWDERHQIAVRVGQALAYLHEELATPIVHGNLTTRSIMLEEPDMNPKLFDFGLQFLFPDLNVDNLNPAFSSFATELLQWTAPEHKTGTTLIKKSATSDVYSFGILILVLVSGRRVIDPKYPDTTVIDSACEIYNEGEVLNFLDDSLPAGSVTSEKMMLIMQVALLCLQEDAQRRPKASEAVQMLLGKVAIAPNRLMNLTAYVNQSD